MNLYTQLCLGNLANQLGYIFSIFLIVICLPMIIWFVVSIYTWRVLRSRKLLKFWLITTGIISLLGLGILVCVKTFGGAAYTVASRVHIYIPMSVDVLESDHLVAIDEEQDYVVVRFSHPQVDTFIESVKEKGWKSGMVTPYSLINLSPGLEDPMSGRNKPLPRMKRSGYYYSLMKKRYKGHAWYTTRKAYFLDVKSRTLYMYYDDSQWG